MPLLPRDRDIVLSLQGGLGNQLFEWAFAEALTASGRNVLFDRVRLRGPRPYALGDLVAASARLPRPVGAVLAIAERRGLINATSRMRNVRQKKSGYDPSVLEGLSGMSYLRGYFQSTQYFESVADVVRAQVAEHLSTMLTAKGARFADELRADPTSVAVHVRRGDYVSNPVTAKHHGVLDAGYYANALAIMEDRGHTRRVWFSDDLDWVTENLARPGDSVCPADAVRNDGGEIALMASCSARIIANSSFSWWGGWLGGPSTEENPVIAPVVWFAAGHSDASDLVPAEWIRL